MKAPGADCENCPLKDKPIAPTQGPQDSEVILVSRSPGYHEAMNGKPFSGPSGQVLDHLLKQNGVERGEIRVTNVVLCAPDEGAVPKEAIQCCSGRLRRELQSASLAIAAGSEAVSLILGKTTVDRARGYSHHRPLQDGKSLRVVATNNPALVLRDDSKFPNLVRDFRRAFNPLPRPKFPSVTIITDIGEARGAIREILAKYKTSGVTYIAADTESRGGLTHKAELVSVQFSATGDHAVVFGDDPCHDDEVLAGFKEFFELENIRFIWHNGKWDTKILRYGYGINARVDEDTLLQSYALDERSGEESVHSLEYLLMEHFGWPNYEPKSVKQFKKDGIVTNGNELYRYAGYDAAGTKQLFDLQDKELDSDNAREAYNLLLSAVPMISDMEMHGFVYDIERAADLYDYEIKPELEALKNEMRTMLDNPIFNPGSPAQLSHLFYDTWGIHHSMRDRPDKDRSVDIAALNEVLRGNFTTHDELIVKETLDEPRNTAIALSKLLMRHRKLSKQASTYIKNLIERAVEDPEGRIYTDLKLHGTNSGRPSSSKPNLLNITRDKEDLPSIRKLFKPSPGRVIVQADYSQAELRCIAQMSKDPELMRIYSDALDLHNIAAERFYGPGFKKEQRSRAKNMNFGVAYRQTADTFQEKHDIPVDEAEKFIKWWWQNFQGVYNWEKDIEQQIHKVGYLQSGFGRKRRFHLITKENRFAAYREGINFYPQSTAADLTLTSCIILNQRIDRSRAALCLTVYDSIIADVEEGYVDEYKKITKEVMESRAKEALGWDLPFLVDIGTGLSWGEIK